MKQKLIQFGPDQADAVERLAHELGGTQSAIVRAGLALLQVVVRETRRGNGVGIIQGDRVVKELVGVWSGTSEQQTPAA